MIADCVTTFDTCLTECQSLKLNLILNGNTDNDDDDSGDNENNRNGCYLQVTAGSGGLEAQDWAETILNMYVNYCKKQNKKYDIVFTRPSNVGILQSLIEIKDEYSYAWFKYEEGIHRRSRVSPYGTGAGKRQTSFASVTVSPMINNSDGGKGGKNSLISHWLDNNGNIREKDLSFEAFRGSGPGGQHRNTTDSCVRVVHLPTGINVTCQDDRSLNANKVSALNYLEFKLIKMEQDKEKQYKQEKHDSLSDATFGSKMRNYIFTPYQMVKDVRTGYESRNTQSILDGNIDAMLQHNLQYFAAQSFANACQE